MRVSTGTGKELLVSLNVSGMKDPNKMIPEDLKRGLRIEYRIQITFVALYSTHRLSCSRMYLSRTSPPLEWPAWKTVSRERPAALG